MMMSGRLVPITLATALSLVLLGSAVVVAQGGPPECPPNSEPEGRACYEQAVEAHRANARPQTDAIEKYNQAPGKYAQLPWAPLDIAQFDQAQSVTQYVPPATHIALARIVRVEFLGSNLADFPAMDVSYVAVEPIKGFSSGDRFLERVLGGPLRLDDGKEVFTTLPRRGVDRSGDLVLVVLAENGPGSYGNVNVSVRFRVDNKGNIIDDENARALNLSGKPVADLIGELKAAAGN